MPNVVVYLYLLNACSRKGGLRKKGMRERRSFWICPCSEAASDWTLAAENVLLPPWKGRAEEGKVHAGVRQASCCRCSAYAPHPTDQWLLCCSGLQNSWAKHHILISSSARLLSAPGSLGSCDRTSLLTTQSASCFCSYLFLYFNYWTLAVLCQFVSRLMNSTPCSYRADLL